MENRFEERYQTGDTPWDHGTPDNNLIDMVKRRPISPCKVLDVGCGTGENTIWLCREGFTATGCDISPTAIEMARKKADEAIVKCTFLVADFLKDTIPESPFGLIFDRGCLHTFRDGEERRHFAKSVFSHLETDGLWLTLAGNADGTPREIGPPRLTASELVSAVEPYFEIVSLTAGHFGSDQADPPEAWVCLMQRRT